MSVVKPVPAVPSFIRDKCVGDDMISVNGPYSLDEVIVPDTLRDFYERWLEHSGIQQGQTRPTLAQWCSDICSLDPNYHIYVIKFIYDKVYHHKTLLKIADQSKRDVLISIPLVHVRKDFFEANFYHGVTPATYNACVQKDFADKYDWNEVVQFMTVTFSLPTWDELYVDDEFGEFVVSQQHHRNTQTHSETDPRDITVQIEECDGVTIRTTTTRVGDTDVRQHTHFEDAEDVAELISPVPHTEDDESGSPIWCSEWNERAFMVCEDTDADNKGVGRGSCPPCPSGRNAFGGTTTKEVDVIPADEDTQTLLDDLKYWEIKEETDKSLLVYPNNSMSWFRGRYGYIKPEIPTGRLYHRPLYLSNHGGFWINKTSELSKLILKNQEESTESQDDDETTTTTTISKRSVRFADDLDNWLIGYIIKNKKTQGWTARIVPSVKSAFSHCPSVIDTDGLYHRPLYYCDKNKGYYINTASQLYKTLMDRPFNW